MIINIIFAHDECSISQMNIKSLSLNEENENFEYTSWRHNMYQGPEKEGDATIGGNTVLLFVRLTGKLILNECGRTVSFFIR